MTTLVFKLIVAFRPPRLRDHGCPAGQPGRGALRNVQELVGHRSIRTTQRYIEGDAEAQRPLIRLL